MPEEGAHVNVGTWAMTHWLLQHHHLPQYINFTWFFFLFPSEHISHVNPFMCYSTSVTLMYIIMGSLKSDGRHSLLPGKLLTLHILCIGGKRL